VYLYICTLDDIHITYNFNEIILACLEILGYSKNNNIEVVNRVKTLLDDYIINGKAQLQCITSLIMRFGKQMDEMMDK
jgi:preprotein translocase subunit SecF